MKDELESWLFDLVDDVMERQNTFLSFHSEADRFVFVKISSIKRIIFCWDIVPSKQEYILYRDNFDLLSEEDEPIIPELIIKIRSSNEPLVFDNFDPDSDLLGIDENSFRNQYFIKVGFLNVLDEDGDQNFIPMVSVECIEVNRVYIYPDEIWQEMQRQSELENSSN